MPGVLTTRKTRAARGKLGATAPAKKDASPFAPENQVLEINLPSRKRKGHDDDEQTSSKKARGAGTRADLPAPLTPVSRKNKTVKFADPVVQPEGTLKAPSAAIFAPVLPSVPSASSRKRRFDPEDNSPEALLSRLNIQSPTKATLKKKKTTPHRRAPLTDFDLPRELNDLLDMHQAFTKTLAVQAAHATRGAPIDLRDLYDSVTRAWGKRHVHIDDIRRCIGVLSWTEDGTTDGPTAPYYLVDYGRDKICIEFHANYTASGVEYPGGPLRVHKLNMDFETNLRTLWENRANNMPGCIFVSTLPKAPLHAPAGNKKIGGPLAPKTQTTLDAFKRQLAEKKAAQEQEKQNTATTTQQQQLSLLDRIRIKQAALAAQPSAEELSADAARRRALQRCPDVAAVIAMLCKAGTSGPQARMSFTMAALLARLRDSLGANVGNDDAAQSVRLLASEVAPQWLRVVKVGGKEMVVVMVAQQVAKGVVEEKVKALLG
ncbi:hypothetical protein VTJ04DRAFT_9952 [Mycothermus thermophilus]|uniref:uncharacterized protein n=1 Tax=Humicola insolens TaxID=85995 RepID=UPI0037442D0E